MGLDWDEGIPDPFQKPTKPLLILIPGVAGDSDNMYQIALIKHIRKHFKIVTLLFRGSVPLTSPKLASPASWHDIEAGIEFVANKYCHDPKTGEKSRRFYAYGCSMGATLLGCYLVNNPDDSGKFLDGAVLYGTPWDYVVGGKPFFENYGGWPSYFVAMNVCRITRSKQLP